MNDDLFHWIWYTCSFVNSAERARIYAPDKTIRQIYDEFVREHPQVQQNKVGFTLVNQGLIMMIAYGICVFTKERFPLFAKKSDLPIESKKLFGVVSDEEKSMDNREQFLRRIRNAVAHMNIKFSQNVSIEDSIGVELWDAKKSRPPNFRVTISVKNFMVFLNEIGHQFGDWWQKYRLSM